MGVRLWSLRPSRSKEKGFQLPAEEWPTPPQVPLRCRVPPVGDRITPPATVPDAPFVRRDRSDTCPVERCSATKEKVLAELCSSKKRARHAARPYCNAAASALPAAP